MVFLSDNLKQIFADSKETGANFPLSIRDFAGWGAVIGLGLSFAAWKLNWASGLVTLVLSLVFLAGVVCGLLAYPVSQIIFRDEKQPYYYAWAQFSKNKSQHG